MVHSQTLLPLAALLETAAVCIIVLAGLAFMFQARHLAVRVLMGGIALAVLGAIATRFLSVQSDVSLLDLGVAVALVAAIIAYIAGWPRTAAAIVGVALLKWILWFLALQALSVAPWWAKVILAVVAAPLVLLAAIWILQHAIKIFFGREVAAHVSATYLTRTLDSVGRGILWVLTSPRRLLRRGSAG